MVASGMTCAHIAHTLGLLAEERAAAQSISDRVELVWSGTEVMPGGSRDTDRVVQHLFEEAKREVLISSYSMDTGKKAKAIFGSLATRMDADAELRVRLFVNIKREKRKHKKIESAVLVQSFADSFRDKLWPGVRLPEVYYDPRSLSTDFRRARACLHAKVVVIDDPRALITSANFSEAAHARNIEAGVLLTDPVLTRALKAQFDTLVDHKKLLRVPGL